MSLRGRRDAAIELVFRCGNLMGQPPLISIWICFAMAGMLAACRTETPTILVGGSSTVFPLSEAVAEEFSQTTQHRVTVSVAGTGGGFKRFCVGEIAIAGASRPIAQVEAGRRAVTVPSSAEDRRDPSGCTSACGMCRDGAHSVD